MTGTSEQRYWQIREIAQCHYDNSEVKGLVNLLLFNAKINMIVQEWNPKPNVVFRYFVLPLFTPHWQGQLCWKSHWDSFTCDLWHSPRGVPHPEGWSSRESDSSKSTERTTTSRLCCSQHTQEISRATSSNWYETIFLTIFFFFERDLLINLTLSIKGKIYRRFLRQSECFNPNINVE